VGSAGPRGHGGVGKTVRALGEYRAGAAGRRRRAYLCIVPAPRSPDPFAGLPLPFEGDQLLAIILSKAMLLANDTKITDPAITRQIHGSWWTLIFPRR
jgi:hypothetical protein